MIHVCGCLKSLLRELGKQSKFKWREWLKWSLLTICFIRAAKAISRSSLTFFYNGLGNKFEVIFKFSHFNELGLL